MKFLVVSLKFTKDDQEEIKRILDVSIKQLNLTLEYELIDLRTTKFPKFCPKYILCIGEQTINYIQPNLSPTTIAISIPRPKDFLQNQEAKFNVWTVLKSLLLDIKKELLLEVQPEELNKKKLILRAETIANILTNENYINTFNKLLEQGTLVIETKDNHFIHIYPDNIELPNKDKFEYHSNEFLLLLSALLLFNATQAEIKKECN